MENHTQVPWHSMSKEDVLGELDSSSDGLSNAKAEERLQKNGFNELPEKKAKTLGQMLKGQITDPMILILIGSSLLSLFLNQWIEAAAIIFIVILNSVIGIVQESKAQSSIEALKDMSPHEARVLRQGDEYLIPAKNLVCGDIVIISDGSMIPADMRLIESANLKVQESSLTGESVASEKNADDVLDKGCVLGDRSNMVYMSSIVSYGRGIGVVVSTGLDTEVGNIAGALNEESDFDTPLKRKLNYVGKTLTIIGVIVCILVFLIGAFYGRDLIPMLMISISLAISIIPEGLPATATIVMALGVQRMAKENALVRNLPSVETLGGATVICTDKTGTLTLNEMTVTHIAINGDFEKQCMKTVEECIQEPDLYRHLVYGACLCNDAELSQDDKNKIIGDPTEGALIVMAQKFNIEHDELEENHPRLYEQPFDSDRKRMTTVHEIDGQVTAYVKGAVDEMMPFCSKIITCDGIRDITEEDKNNIKKFCLSMSKDALRVLGFAMKKLDRVPDKDGEDIEYDLTFIGVTGMIDPPRKEVAESVRICTDAGIRTIMITGDHKVTALAIAEELGIWKEGNRVVTGDELDTMSEADLDEAVKTATVFSRVSPSDKLKIIKALKRNGEITAMTGDGVNDSPALKEADIGIAMGIGGTDVAKDSSDMILLDDSFTTIVHSVKEGRRIYRNIQKVIQFLLSGNIAEITTLFIATLFNWDSPLLAIHILWVNLVTATLPALALGVDPPSRNVMKHKPVKSGTLFEKILVENVVIQGVFTSFVTLCAYWIGAAMESHMVGQTMAFAVIAFSQMLRSLNMNSNTEYIFNREGSKNKYIMMSFFVSAVFMISILVIPQLQNIFSITDINLKQWIIVIILGTLTMIQIEFVKFLRKVLKNK